MRLSGIYKIGEHQIWESSSNKQEKAGFQKNFRFPTSTGALEVMCEIVKWWEGSQAPHQAPFVGL